MIKTINLIANEEKTIEIRGGNHAKIKNLGDSTVYVSKLPNVVPCADEVKSIQGGNSDILVDVATYCVKDGTADYYGNIYALSDDETKIEIETTNNSNFKQIAKGGDGLMPIVSSNGFICVCDPIEYIVATKEEI